MHRFLGVVRYEYHMSVRRWGLWLAFGLVNLPILWAMLSYLLHPELDPLPDSFWQYAGDTVFQLNVLAPVVAGIAIADRLVRDDQLHVDELLHGTPLSRPGYILGKYMGALLSVLVPVLMLVLLINVFLIAAGLVAGQPVQLQLLPMFLVAFLAITVPAYAFITAFSLACPLIMPVRVYQVLFTGYWFWGNFLSPKVFPTLNGTLLTPSGEFAAQGFFYSAMYGPAGDGPASQPFHTATDAVLNLLVLAACIVAVLFAVNRYLAWRARRA